MKSVCQTGVIIEFDPSVRGRQEVAHEVCATLGRLGFSAGMAHSGSCETPSIVPQSGPADAAWVFKLGNRMGSQPAAAYCMLSLCASADRLPPVARLVDLVPRHAGASNMDQFEYDILPLTTCRPLMEVLINHFRMEVRRLGVTILVAYVEDVATVAAMVAGACGVRLLVVRNMSDVAGLHETQSVVSDSNSRTYQKTISCSVEGLRPEDVALLFVNVSYTGATKTAIRGLLEPRCAQVHEVVLLEVKSGQVEPGGLLCTLTAAS